MGTGPGSARQDSAGRVFGRFWNRTQPFFRSESGPLAGYPDPLLTLDRTDAMYLCSCVFAEPGHLWLLPGWVDSCSIWNISETISWVTVSFPNVVGGGAAVTLSFWGVIQGGIFNIAVLYFSSLRWKWLVMSTHPKYVNWSSFIGFCWYLSRQGHFDLEIVHITQPGSSLLPSLPGSVSSISSYTSPPSSLLSEHARSLRLSIEAFNIFSHGFSGVLVVNLALSVFVISSCSYLIAVAASSFLVLATAVALAI